MKEINIIGVDLAKERVPAACAVRGRDGPFPQKAVASRKFSDS